MILPDLTLTEPGGQAKADLTVGQIVAAEASLEEMLDALGDGEFQTGVLARYDYCPELESSLRDAIGRFASEPLVDRTTLHRVLNSAMNSMENEGVPWHPGLLKVLKTLESGGPVRLKPREPHHPAPHHPAPPGSPAGRLERGEITDKEYETIIRISKALDGVGRRLTAAELGTRLAALLPGIAEEQRLRLAAIAGFAPKE